MMMNGNQNNLLLEVLQLILILHNYTLKIYKIV